MAADRVAFHYVQSNYFRVVHADGAMGAPTPRGAIQFSLYSERTATPEQVVHRLEPDGRLSEQTERHGADGITREIEVGVVMDEMAAASFYDWLGEQLSALRARR